MGRMLSCVPWEMKIRGVPFGRDNKWRNPGEKATMDENKSLFMRPNESASVAPSEKPASAMRFASTEYIANILFNAESMNATSDGSSPATTPQLGFRESGARRIVPVSSA